MDLKTGSLLLEVVAAERTYARWKAFVEERLTALRTGVRYLVSDRAKALIQLAAVGLECMSMPDVFPVMHDLVQSYSCAIARRVHQAQQALKKAEEVLSKQPGPPGQPEAFSAPQHQVEGCRMDVQRWQGVYSASRHHLAVLSLVLHPFDIDDSTPQNAVQVHSRLEAEVAALET